MQYFLIFLCFLSSVAVAFAQTASSAVSPTSVLKGEQRDYYVRNFNYAMETAKANETYSWKEKGAEGKIRVSEKYVSKSEALCRNFSETFEINTKIQNNSGVACKRNGKAGWCRLKPEDAHTCALENPPDLAEKILNDMGSAISGGGNAVNKAKGWLGF